jgi:hypothetical protein
MRCRGLLFAAPLFFKDGDGRWHQKRADKEIKWRHEQAEAQIARTAAALAARGIKRNVTSNVTSNVTFTKPEPEPEPEPDIKPDTPLSGGLGGFPVTVEAAVVHSEFIGCPKEFAMRVWNKAQGRGGRDAKDVPIRSFRHHLQTEWTYERERVHKAKPTRKGPNI